MNRRALLHLSWKLLALAFPTGGKELFLFLPPAYPQRAEIIKSTRKKIKYTSKTLDYSEGQIQAVLKDLHEYILHYYKWVFDLEELKKGKVKVKISLTRDFLEGLANFKAGIKINQLKQIKKDQSNSPELTKAILHFEEVNDTLEHSFEIFILNIVTPYLAQYNIVYDKQKILKKIRGNSK